jgi:hypothetical protein
MITCVILILRITRVKALGSKVSLPLSAPKRQARAWEEMPIPGTLSPVAGAPAPGDVAGEMINMPSALAAASAGGLQVVLSPLSCMPRKELWALLCPAVVAPRSADTPKVA